MDDSELVMVLQQLANQLEAVQSQVQKNAIAIEVKNFSTYKYRYFNAQIFSACTSATR
jgi:hypothetical protein